MQHCLAAITKARSLDCQRVDRAAQLVDDQCRQRLAVYILGDDDKVLRDLQYLLKDRQDLLDAADLLVGDQDVGIVKLCFLPLDIGHHVARDVATVELHAFGVLFLEGHALRLFDGDDAILADLLHHLGDQLTDLTVGRRVGRYVRNVSTVTYRHGARLNGGHQRLGTPIKAALDQHRIRTGCDNL